jgi:hypothetical protein
MGKSRTFLNYARESPFWTQVLDHSGHALDAAVGLAFPKPQIFETPQKDCEIVSDPKVTNN